MRSCLTFMMALMCVLCWQSTWAEGRGITPEQIYQPKVKWQALIGTWEVLPDTDPLAEQPKSVTDASRRTLMTLRKDGTCRVFSSDHPSGTDGMWTFEDHAMFISFPGNKRIRYYVYGVRGDFMVTRSFRDEDTDLLWSKVK